ncbi:winged helix-turn-helix domain-containing protein [Gammaproteobacteria bacterium]|nr:winged helix-turn-helix domain-containing protein [Gammaproteobacteria bacterium]MDB9968914.1 winged helix-turn-helix domain-containing protein [Gammaproteobacteria bacterium]
MPTLTPEQTEQNRETRQLGTKPALSREFSLGEWRVLPQLNRIRYSCTNEERQLEPRLIKLLCFLGANEERVLSREELVQELWPRVVVNENSLTRAISELRKQLQSQDSRAPNYIETIPKRGYRLLTRIEPQEAEVTTRSLFDDSRWTAMVTVPTLRVGAAASAACLCLLIAGWVTLEGGSLIDRGLDRMSSTVLLSDELLDNKPYQGGELQLSTLDRDSSAVEYIATPIVSLDEKQYAFIQYDTSGSTIFLGGLGTAIEPVPVYYSSQHVFNLAWSPVGNNLLFAMKPSMTTAAMYSSVNERAELITLNLNTLETSRLLEDIHPADSNPSNGRNLT